MSVVQDVVRQAVANKDQQILADAANAAKASLSRTTAEKLLESKKPLERTITVFLDGDTVASLDKAQEKQADLELALGTERLDLIKTLTIAGSDPEAIEAALSTFDADADRRMAPVADAVSVAEQAVRETSVEIVFRSIGRLAYDELLNAHPPREEDHEKVNRGVPEKERGKAQFNLDTWGPALVAASSELSEEDVARLWDEWNMAELNELYNAAFIVNNTRRSADLGKGHG